MVERGKGVAKEKAVGKTRAKAKTEESLKTAPKARKTASDQGSNRGEKGKFAPGTSGNPGGRPLLPPELKEAAKAASHEALTVLITIMRNAESPEAARIRAAEIIMNRAYGTPPASVEMSGSVNGGFMFAALSNEELEKFISDAE